MELGSWQRQPGLRAALEIRAAKGQPHPQQPNNEPRTSHARTPHHLLEGTITPNGLHFTIVQSFTRFRAPWNWNGPAILQSRAWDEAGNVQPLRADFVAVRGQTARPVTNPLAFTNQHYNSITSWAVDPSGQVKHVYA